jgi:hypothetical protein
MHLVIGGFPTQSPSRLACALLGLALLAGCATAPSTTPSSPREPRQPREFQQPRPVETEPAVRADPPEREGSPEVRFDTDPDGADLLLDNRLRGTTPLVLNSLSAGLYKIEARKPGYQTVSEWVSHPGGGARYTIVLRRLAGRLAVSVAPDTARVTVGGMETSAGAPVDFPAGTYILRAEAFGYLPAERSVTVEPGATAAAALALAPAPLSARLARVEHRRFDPAGRRDTAQVRLDYEITAPARGELIASDDSGAVVYRERFDAAAARGTRSWSGMTEAGTSARAGRYLLRLEFTSDRGQHAGLEASVFVTRTPAGRVGADTSGLSGLRYAPNARTAAPGEGAVLVTTSLMMEPGAAAPADSAPVTLAARYGIVPGLEAGASVSAFLEGEPPLPFAVTTAVKQRIVSAGAFSAAAVGRLSLQAGDGSDPLGAFTGAAAAFASAVEAGSFSVSLTPEVVASPWRVTGDNSYDDNPGFNLWAYMRGSVSVAFPAGLVGVSSALRTRPFAAGGGIAWPLLAAAEGHWRPQGSRLAVSAFAAAEVGPASIERVAAGTTFSWLY